MEHARIAQVVLALAVALALAVLAAHPRVQAIERRLGITVLLSTGLPFLALGALFHLERVGVLTPTVLGHLSPAFEFGLAWIGFVVGIQFDLRRLDRLAPGIGAATVLQASVPMVCVAALSLGALLLLGVEPGAGLARKVVLLSACAAPSATTGVVALRRRYGDQAATLVEQMTNLDEIGSLAVLGLVAIFYRPDASTTTWVLPSSAWLVLTLGLGTLLGGVTYILVRGAHHESEELALLLGAIALAAGLAGQLALSIPVVTALAGALLANLPLREPERLKRLLLDVERPLYLVFLMVVGASWRPDEWQGWVLAPVFVIGRVYGKTVGARAARRLGPPALPPARPLSLAILPQSPFAIVVMVSAGLLHRDAPPPPPLRWCVNAVILGGVLTEVVVRVLQWLDAQRGGGASDRSDRSDRSARSDGTDRPDRPLSGAAE